MKKKRSSTGKVTRAKAPARDRMEQVITVIQAACRAKGWLSSVESLDRQNWRYATVAVRRQTVTGNLEVTVDNRVGVRREQTSFYGYGLSNLHDAVMNELSRLPWLKSDDKVKPPAPLEHLRGVLLNFHKVAHQLTIRQRDRAPFVIEDEYDVQDLLHALLRGLFSDVRPEEVVPSYAGGSSRIDFLLKQEGIVIEAKMTNERLRDRQMGEQLIVDIKRYQAHPDYKTLICLVYDPRRLLRNPSGLQTDLNGKHGQLEVQVIISPPA